MSEDIPPIKAFLLTLREIRHARTRREQGRILDLAETILSHRPTPDQLSRPAQRLLDAMGNQTLHRVAWARLAGSCFSADSGTFKEAVRELIASGHVARTKRGNYHKARAKSTDQAVVPISSKTQAVS